MTYQQLLIKALKFIKDERIRDIPVSVLEDYCNSFDTETLNEVEWKLLAKDGLVYLTFLNLKIEKPEALLDSCVEAFKRLENDLFQDIDTPLELLLNFALMTVPLLFFSDYDKEYIDKDYQIPKLATISQEELREYVYQSLNRFKKTFTYETFLNPRILEFMNESETDYYSPEEEDSMINYVNEIESNNEYYDPIPYEEDKYYDPNGFYCCTEDNETLYFKYDTVWSSVYNEGVFINYLMKQIYLIKMLISEVGETAIQTMISLDQHIDIITEKLNGDYNKSIITEIYNITDEPVADYDLDIFQKDSADELVKYILGDEELLDTFSLDELALIIVSFKPNNHYSKEEFIKYLKSIKRIISSSNSLPAKAKKIEALSKRIRKI